MVLRHLDLRYRQNCFGKIIKAKLRDIIFTVFLDKQIVELTEISAVWHILARVFQNVLGKRLERYRRSGLFRLGFFGGFRENNHAVSADKLGLAVDKTRETL